MTTGDSGSMATLFTALECGIAVFHPVEDDPARREWRIGDVNPAFLTMLDLTPDELHGPPALDVAVEGPAHVWDWFERCLSLHQAGAAAEFVGYLHHLERWFKVTLHPVGDDGFALVLYDETEHRHLEETLWQEYSLGAELGAVNTLDHALHAVLDASVRIVGIDCGGIYLVNHADRSIDLAAHVGLSEAFVALVSHYDFDSPRSREVLAGQSIYMDDARLGTELNRLLRSEGLLALAAIPIMHDGQPVAMMNLASRTVREFSKPMRDVIELIATQVGGALARLRAERDSMQTHTDIDALVNTMPDFLFILDAGGRIIRTNPVVNQQLGFTPEELHGRSVLDVHPPEQRALAQTIVTEMIAGRETMCPIPLMARDGSLIPVETRVTRGEWNGRPALFGLSRDITERRQHERRLAQLSLAMEQSPVGMVITDLGGLAEQANVAFSRLTGYAREEIIGRCPFRTMATSADRDQLGALHAAVGRREGWQGEMWFRRQTGEVFIASCSFSPVEATPGMVTHYLAVVDDITEQKRVQAERLHQERVLKGVAEMARVLLTSSSFADALRHSLRVLGTLIDADRVYVYELCEAECRRPALVRRYEWSNASSVLAVTEDLQFRSMAVDGVLHRWYDELSAGRAVNSVVGELPPEERALLSTFDIKAVLALPILVDGRFWGFLGCDNCREARKWSEAESVLLTAAASNIGGAVDREISRATLLQAKDRAELSDRVKSSMLAAISHELRTPLNGILGFTALMRGMIMEPDLATMAGNIDFSAHRLLATVDAVLTLAQLEGAAIKVQPERIRPVVVFQPLVEEYSPLAAAKGLTFEFDMTCAPDLVVTDQKLLSMAVSKVLDNAVKFSNGGTVKMRLVRMEEVEGWTVEVHDTGIGIETMDMGLIFEPFRQSSEGFGRQYEGLGLGLAIARRAVEALGGSITCQSHRGSGSVFVMTFPEATSDVDGADSAHPVTEQGIPGFDELLAHLGRRPAVLLVEDNELNAMLTRAMLKTQCDVTMVMNATDAIAACNARGFDAILMDINLGRGMDGIEATQHIRVIDGFASTPVAALTGYTLTWEREKILASGLTHFLEKPFIREDLLLLVRAMLSGVTTNIPFSGVA